MAYLQNPEANQPAPGSSQKKKSKQEDQIQEAP
jgi:hypothetical protein